MIEHELAPVPAGEAHHHRCEGRQREAVRQDRRRIDQAQTPVGAYDRSNHGDDPFLSVTVDKTPTFIMRYGRGNVKGENPEMRGKCRTIYWRTG